MLCLIDTVFPCLLPSHYSCSIIIIVCKCKGKDSLIQDTSEAVPSRVGGLEWDSCPRLGVHESTFRDLDEEEAANPVGHSNRFVTNFSSFAKLGLADRLWYLRAGTASCVLVVLFLIAEENR